MIRRLVWSDNIEHPIRDVNSSIHRLAAEKVFIFEAAKILSDENGKLKPEYNFDELHLNEAGYQALNLELVKLLESLKQESP